MAQAYLGEIRMFSGTFAPVGWLECGGQILPISEFDTLFNLIGTTYGGDGVETFRLPDLRGRVPVHTGRGTAMTEDYPLGTQGGAEGVSLSPEQLPVHKHAFMASKGPGSSRIPEGNVIGSPPAVKLLKEREEPEKKLAPTMVAPAGESLPHENRTPYLTVTFIICIDGDYPSKS
jgi:microcystin-dependent protein